MTCPSCGTTIARERWSFCRRLRNQIGLVSAVVLSAAGTVLNEVKELPHPLHGLVLAVLLLAAIGAALRVKT